MSMSYVNEILERVAAQNPDQPEFLQAVTEVLESLRVVIEKNEDVYSKNDVGDPVQLYAACSDKLEAIRVCDVIRAVGRRSLRGMKLLPYSTALTCRAACWRRRCAGVEYRIAYMAD